MRTTRSGVTTETLWEEPQHYLKYALLKTVKTLAWPEAGALNTIRGGEERETS